MELLPETRRPAYTTVQTIVYRLEEKGALRRTRKIGNAHIFEPVVSRKEAHHRLIDDLLSLFGGSPRPLMAHLIETGRLTLEDLRSLERSFGEQPVHSSLGIQRRSFRHATAQVEETRFLISRGQP